jgi:hypothetical protein
MIVKTNQSRSPVVRPRMGCSFSTSAAPTRAAATATTVEIPRGTSHRRPLRTNVSSTLAWISTPGMVPSVANTVGKTSCIT